MFRRIEKTVLVWVAGCMIVAFRSPLRLLTLRHRLFMWFPGRSWYTPPSFHLSQDCLPRFQPWLFRTAAQQFMIEVSDRDVLGLGVTFPFFSPVCISISPTCMSVLAEAPLTSLCPVITYSEKGTVCLWLQPWFLWR